MTPLHLSILLCAHTGSPFQRPGDTPVRSKYANHLVDWGLIVEAEPGDATDGVMHTATDRGHAWVEHILEVPLPERQWVVPAKLPAGGDGS